MHNADPNTFNEWANQIGKSAKEICNGPECKRIRLSKEDNGTVRFEFADSGVVDCVIQAIKNQLGSKPTIQ